MALTIATRGSSLALWQANHVRSRLEAAHPGLDVRTRVVRTTGDRVSDVPLSAIGGRGLFTREVDDALLRGDADLAVHSLKDLPTTPEPGLDIGAVTERADPRDVVVCRSDAGSSLDALAPGARVGTSSLRRRAQLLARRPDLKAEDLRGNLDTRLRRVAEAAYDAIILAAAGLLRLGRGDAIDEVLDPPEWLPAVGQGALGITIRGDDEVTRRLLTPLDHDDTRAATTAERAFLNALEGGCQVPIGALATVQAGQLRIHGLVAALDGATVLRDAVVGPATSPDRLGRELAANLDAMGAGRILDGIRAMASLPQPGAP